MLCSVLTELGFCKPDSGLLSPTGSPLGCEHRRQEVGPRGGRKERSHFQVLDINATAPDVAPFPSTGISHHCGGLLQPYPFSCLQNQPLSSHVNSRCQEKACVDLLKGQALASRCALFPAPQSSLSSVVPLGLGC